MATKRKRAKSKSETYTQWRKRVLGIRKRIRAMGNPVRKLKGKSTTLKNMASVTIQKLPNGVVKITGRKMAARANPRTGAHHKRGNREWWVVRAAANSWALRRRVFNKGYGSWIEQADRLFTSRQEANEAGRDWASG